MGHYSCIWCGAVLENPAHDGMTQHCPGECAQRQVTAMAALLREHIDRALLNGEKRFVKLEDAAKNLRSEWREELMHAMPGVEPMEHEADVLHEILGTTSTETLTSAAKRLMRELDVARQHEKEAVQGRADQALLVEALKKQMAEGFDEREVRFANIHRELRRLFGAIGDALEPGAGNAPVVIDAAIDDVKELRHILDEAERRYGAVADERNKLMSLVAELRRQIQDSMTEGT